MIQLGSIVLRHGLVWDEAFSYTGVVQEIKMTLGGVPKVYTATVSGPMPITLRSLEDQGWQTYATVTALQSISKSPDGSFPLIFGDRSFIVSFRHYESPVFEVTPLIPRTQYGADDFFGVVLKLVAYSA